MINLINDIKNEYLSKSYKIIFNIQPLNKLVHNEEDTDYSYLAKKVNIILLEDDNVGFSAKRT